MQVAQPAEHQDAEAVLLWQGAGCTSHNFLALVNLTMDFCGDTLQAYRFEAGSMPKLENLTICFLGNWTCVVTGIEHLTKLKAVQLSGSKTNDAFNHALEQFKAESARREAGSSQFQVIVKYFLKYNM
jgi:hypothetical protein